MFESLKSPNPFRQYKMLSYCATSFCSDIERLNGDPEAIISRLDELYTYLFEMAGVYELSACAVAFERELQNSYLRALQKNSTYPALLLWQKHYGLTNDSIKKVAEPFRDRLIDEIVHFQKTKEPSPAILMFIKHFPRDTPSTEIFRGFNFQLDGYLDYAIFQQVRFIALYAQSSNLFEGQRDSLKRSVGLSMLLKESRTKKIDRQITELKKEGLIDEAFSLDTLRSDAMRDLSWIKPRDSRFLLNLRKEKWTPEFLSRFGIDVSTAFEKVSQKITDRRLPHSVALNYIAFIEMSIDALRPELNESALKNAAHVLSRLEYSDLNKPFDVLSVAERIIACDSLTQMEKAGAHLHLHFALGNQAAMPPNVDLKGGLRTMLKEVSGNARLELEAHRFFGVDSIKGKRLSGMKRRVISEDMGL